MNINFSNGAIPGVSRCTDTTSSLRLLFPEGIKRSANGSPEKFSRTHAGGMRATGPGSRTTLGIGLIGHCPVPSAGIAIHSFRRTDQRFGSSAQSHPPRTIHDSAPQTESDPQLTRTGMDENIRKRKRTARLIASVTAFFALPMHAGGPPEFRKFNIFLIQKFRGTPSAF